VQLRKMKIIIKLSRFVIYVRSFCCRRHCCW